MKKVVKVLKIVLLVTVLSSLLFIVVVDTGYAILTTKFLGVSGEVTEVFEQKQTACVTLEDSERWADFLEKEVIVTFSQTSMRFAQVTEDMNMLTEFELKAKSVLKLYDLVNTYEAILSKMKNFEVTKDEQ